MIQFGLRLWKKLLEQIAAEETYASFLFNYLNTAKTKLRTMATVSNESIMTQR